MRWLLRDTRLRIIFITEVINAFGTGLSGFALAWFLRKENPALAGAILGAQGTGLIVGTVVLGSFLDRWDRRRTLLTANLVLGVLVAALAALLSAHAIAIVILGVSGIVGFVTGVVHPALFSSIPMLAGEQNTQQVNALFNATWQTAGLVAPILAGVMTSLIGATKVLYLDAASFVLAAIGYSRVTFPMVDRSRPKSEGVDRWSPLREWFGETKEGFAYFFKQPVLWGTMMGVAALNAGFESLFLLLPRVVDRMTEGVAFLRHFGVDRGAVGFGFFDTATVIMELLVSLYLAAHLVGRTNRSARWWTLLGCVGPLVGMWAICQVSNLALALVISALIGVTVALVSTVWPALFARVVPAQLSGRVYSVRTTVGSIGRPIGATLTGYLLVSASVERSATIVMGTLTFISVLGFFLASKLSNRHPEANHLESRLNTDVRSTS